MAGLTHLLITEKDVKAVYHSEILAPCFEG